MANSSSVSKCSEPERFDWLLWGSCGVIVIAYLGYWLSAGQGTDTIPILFAGAVFDLLNTIWWGLVIGVVMVGLLGKVPRQFMVGFFGQRGVRGMIKAAFAGVLLDLCSHGILMVGAKLYERGVSIGQVIAFLIASPWNSFSLTIILIALVGVGWTLIFVVFSVVIAIVTGLLFEWLEAKQFIPSNRQMTNFPQDFRFWKMLGDGLKNVRITPVWIGLIFRDGLKDSQMVFRWILFGIILASVFRAFVSADHFETYFGPTWLGLWLTLVAATVMEICSEGSLPIAADLLTRAKAPGNGFMFLMAGVATDYTEVMVLKNTTASWRIALLLPAITVPQIVLLAWIMNQWSI